MSQIDLDRSSGFFSICCVSFFSPYLFASMHEHNNTHTPEREKKAVKEREREGVCLLRRKWNRSKNEADPLITRVMNNTSPFDFSLLLFSF